MAEPNSDYPLSLRPGSSIPHNFARPLIQQQQQTPPAQHYYPQALEGPVSPEEHNPAAMMASQPYNTHASFEVESPPVSGPEEQSHPLINRALGPDDAPRSRSSQFGLQYSNPGNQAPPMPMPVSQPVLFAQHSGPTGLQPQSPVSQAGPSNSRQTAHHQATSPVMPSSTVSTQPGSAATTRPGTASRSPFTTPITCPPRNRPNQILLVNPTSTMGLSNLLLTSLRPILPHGLEVTAYSAPYPAPTAIESTVDSILSSETVLRDLAKYSTNNGETVQNFDALVIASYSKHPLVEALRESYDVPIVGILEASLYVARMLGGRFGVVTTSTRMKFQIDDAVAAHGLSHFLVGVESMHINPLELMGPPFLTSPSSSSATPTATAAAPSDRASMVSTPSTNSRPREELHKRLSVQSRALVARGADTIILGSEFLSSNEAVRIVKDAVRDEDGRRTVNVVDAVEAGVMMSNSLIGMGVPTSKKGLYRGERDVRRARGQTWL